MSQEPTLFGRSIKRNIIYGLEGTDKEPSDEEIERVAKLANAHDFIEVCDFPTCEKVAWGETDNVAIFALNDRKCRRGTTLKSVKEVCNCRVDRSKE